VNRKRRDGTRVIKLGAVESAVLAGLLDELDHIATDPSPTDPVTSRLYVDGYAEPAAAADFRELTQTSLQRERRDRYGQCRAELPAGGGDLVIAADAMARWLMVVNDMRLALGTRLGVTAEGFADAESNTESNTGTGTGADQAGPDVYAARAAYHWLTALQDDLVTSAMG
jgi:hypothetical protein